MTEAPKSTPEIELLHPFYLDTDMSMAFAAALTGGVALTREEIAQEGQESQAVKTLRGNLRGLLGGALLGGEAGRETTATESATSASRLVLQNTEASIFIARYDELRRAGRLTEDPGVAELRPGQLVSMQLGPAVAPLRRVVDQILRLLDIMLPITDDDETEPGQGAGGSSKQRRKAQRARGYQEPKPDDDDQTSLRQIWKLFKALRDDLDRSGMVDVLVQREDAAPVVLTLDARWASDQTLELLHTSRFTVIGKVTQIWETDEEVVNLYRRSVMSLVPSLLQSVAWWMLAFLAGMASAIDPKEAESAAYEAAGVKQPDAEPDTANGSTSTDDGDSTSDPADTASDEKDDEILIGEDAGAALLPVVTGPAFQILPLAICT